MHLVFGVIKQLGAVIQDEDMSSRARDSLEGIMDQLFEAAKALSDQADRTGTSVEKFIKNNS